MVKGGKWRNAGHPTRIRARTRRRRSRDRGDGCRRRLSGTRQTVSTRPADASNSSIFASSTSNRTDLSIKPLTGK